MGSEPDQVGTDSTTCFQLCRLLFCPISRTHETHTGEVINLKAENLDLKREPYLLSQAIHVPDRTPDSHRETGSVGSTSHEASPVALEKSLACAKSFGEDHCSAQVAPSPLD